MDGEAGERVYIDHALMNVLKRQFWAAVERPRPGSWLVRRATLQPDGDFGRILAAYGGIFEAGSIAWGMAFDGYHPDRFDVIGALVCLAGMAVIMYAPRGQRT